MKYTIHIDLTDDMGENFVKDFDSAEYADERNCIIDASLFIYKQMSKAYEPKAFRDYCKARKPSLNWKSDAVGDG